MEEEEVPHRPLGNLDSGQRNSWMESTAVVPNNSDTSLPWVVQNCTGKTTRDSEELASSPWLVDRQELRWNSRSLRWSLHWKLMGSERHLDPREGSAPC